MRIFLSQETKSKGLIIFKIKFHFYHRLKMSRCIGLKPKYDPPRLLGHFRNIYTPKVNTPQIVYKVAICPRENLPYIQGSSILDHR